MEPVNPLNTNPTKAELTTVYNSLNQHVLTFYSKRVLRLTIEFACYFLFALALFVALFKINLSVTAGSLIDGEIIFYKLTASTAQKVANIMKVITILAGLLFLVLGLYIRNVRRHHEKVHQAANKLNELIKRMN